MSQKDIITVLNPASAVTDDVSCTGDQVCTARFNAIEEMRGTLQQSALFNEVCIISHFNQ